MTGNTPDPKKEARHRLLNDFVTLPEAAVVAHVHTIALDATIPDAQRDEMAEQLSKLVTLYSLSDDRTNIRALSAEDMRGGTFTGGGRLITFKDGRPPITGLAVTRTALRAALEVLKRPKSG